MVRSFTKLMIILTSSLLIHKSVIAQDCSANAGGNFITCSSTTTLNGAVTGSVSSSNPPTWTFISGPTTPTIVSPNSLTTDITGMDVDGQYTFRLTQNCNSGVAISNVTVTAHPRPANFTAGNDINTICATVGEATLNGVIPSGFTGKWTILSTYNLHRSNRLDM